MEVVQAADAAHQGRDRGGKGRLGVVGEMRLAVDDIAPQAGMQRRLNLTGGAAEPNRISCARDADHRQSLALQPLRNDSDVGGIRTKAVAKLFRCKPAVKIGGAICLLGAQQTVEVSLLSGGRRQHKCDPLQWQTRVDGARVQARLGLGMHRSAQRADL